MKEDRKAEDQGSPQLPLAGLKTTSWLRVWLRPAGNILFRLFGAPENRFPNIVAVVSLVIAVISAVSSYRANEIAVEANQISQKNVEESERIAREVAEHQVTFALRSEDQKARIAATQRLISTLNEFIAIYQAAIKRVTGHEGKAVLANLEEVNDRMKEIDSIVVRTAIFERMHSDIADFLNVYPETSGDQPYALRNIRASVSLVPGGGQGYLSPTVLDLIVRNDCIDWLTRKEEEFKG